MPMPDLPEEQAKDASPARPAVPVRPLRPKLPPRRPMSADVSVLRVQSKQQQTQQKGKEASQDALKRPSTSQSLDMHMSASNGRGSVPAAVFYSSSDEEVEEDDVVCECVPRLRYGGDNQVLRDLVHVQTCAAKSRLRDVDPRLDLVPKSSSHQFSAYTHAALTKPRVVMTRSVPAFDQAVSSAPVRVAYNVDAIHELRVAAAERKEDADPLQARDRKEVLEELVDDSLLSSSALDFATVLGDIDSERKATEGCNAYQDGAISKFGGFIYDDSTERDHFRNQFTPPAWHREVGNQYLFSFSALEMGVPEVEPLFHSLTLFDLHTGARRSETFHFNFIGDNYERLESDVFTPESKADASTTCKKALFSVSGRDPHVVALLRVERIVHLHANYYVDKRLHKTPSEVRKKISPTEQNLLPYRQPLAWGVIPIFNSAGDLDVPQGDSNTLLMADSVLKRTNHMRDGREAVEFKLERLYTVPDALVKSDKDLLQIARKAISGDSGVLKVARGIPNSWFSFSVQTCAQPSDLPRNRLDAPSLLPVADPAPLSSPAEAKNPPAAADPLVREMFEFPDVNKKSDDEPSNAERDAQPHAEFSNTMFVYPQSVSLKRQNIVVSVQLRDSDWENKESTSGLKCIYSKSSTPDAMCTVAHSQLSYHCKKPSFQDEFKIELPTALTASTHLFFTFYHLSVKRKPGNLQVLGYSVMPLLQRGRLPHETEFNLPIAARLGQTYLNAIEYMDMKQCGFLNGGSKDFKVRIHVHSSVYPVDKSLSDFFESYSTVLRELDEMHKSSKTAKKTPVAARKRVAAAEAKIESPTSTGRELMPPSTRSIRGTSRTPSRYVSKRAHKNAGVRLLQAASLLILKLKPVSARRFLPAIIDYLCFEIVFSHHEESQYYSFVSLCYFAHSIAKVQKQGGHSVLLVQYVNHFFDGHGQSAGHGRQKPLFVRLMRLLSRGLSLHEYVFPAAKPTSTPPGEHKTEASLSGDANKTPLATGQASVRRLSTRHTPGKTPGKTDYKDRDPKSLQLECVLQHAWLVFELSFKSILLFVHGGAEEGKTPSFTKPSPADTNNAVQAFVHEVVRMIDIVCTILQKHAHRSECGDEFLQNFPALLHDFVPAIAFFFRELFAVLDHSVCIYLVERFISSMRENSTRDIVLVGMMAKFYEVFFSSNKAALDIMFEGKAVAALRKVVGNVESFAIPAAESADTWMGGTRDRSKTVSSAARAFVAPQTKELSTNVVVASRQSFVVLYSMVKMCAKNLANNDKAVRSRVTKMLSSIFCVLEFDAAMQSRRGDWGEMAFTVIPELVGAINHIRNLISDKLRLSILTVWLWVLQHTPEAMVRAWCTQENADFISQYVGMLTLCVSCFAYRGREARSKMHYFAKQGDSEEMKSPAKKKTKRSSLLAKMGIGRGSVVEELGRARSASQSIEFESILNSEFDFALTGKDREQDITDVLSSIKRRHQERCGFSFDTAHAGNSRKYHRKQQHSGLEPVEEDTEPEEVDGASEQEPVAAVPGFEHLLNAEANMSHHVSRVVLRAFSSLVQDGISGLLSGAPVVSDALKSSLALFTAFLSHDQPRSLLPGIYKLLLFFLRRVGSLLFENPSLRRLVGSLAEVVLAHACDLDTTCRKHTVVLLHVLLSFNFDVDGDLGFMQVKLTRKLSEIVTDDQHRFMDESEAALKEVLVALPELRPKMSRVNRKAAEQLKPMMVVLVDKLLVILKDANEINRQKRAGPKLNPALIEQLLYQVAEAFNHIPEIRLAWVKKLAEHHQDYKRYAEAGQCYLNMAELLLKLVAEARVSENSEDYDAAGTTLLVKRATDAFENSLSMLDMAELYEQFHDVAKMMLPLYEAARDYPAMSGTFNSLHLVFEKLIKSNSEQSRMLGTYYRVGFYGTRFGERLNGKEFIYKMPKITRVMEISSELKTLWKTVLDHDVKILPDSGKVDASKFDPDDCCIQMTFVKPVFEVEQDGKTACVATRAKDYVDDNTDLKVFSYSTPFQKQTDGGIKTGAADTASLWKMNTRLHVKYAFPSLKTTQEVCRRVDEELCPIEASTEDVNRRVSSIADIIACDPVEKRRLTQVLIGSVATSVNGGIGEIAEVFLQESDHNKHYSVEMKTKLVLALKDFMAVCQRALEINAEMSDSNTEEEFQKECERRFDALTELLHTHISAHSVSN